MKVVSVEQMRSLDERTIKEAGIPGEELMQRAGDGAGDAIMEFISKLPPEHVKRFVILAGKGNNGGDAYVVAKYLHENTHIPVELYSVSPVSDLKGDALLHAQRLPEYIPVLQEMFELQKGDIVIDGLLGTGTKGALRPPYDKIIQTVNESEVPVISLDLPSGMNGDDGTVTSDALQADLTIAMGLPKKGFLLGDGPELCGIIRCVDIGIPQSYIDEILSDYEMTFACDVKSLKRRPMGSYKSLNGHLLVIGGSCDYHGAPLLAAEAAMRSGAGFVTVCVPESADISTPDMHSLIFRRIPDSGNGTFSIASIPEINQLAEKADVIVVGPGISTAPEVCSMLGEVLKIDKPMVIDADALNIISDNTDMLDRKNITVLTPHPGEMKRLIKGFALQTPEDRIEAAKNLASRTGAVIVLKGNRTVISSPEGEIRINGSGTPALATAGSGDVLSGMIGAFIAQGEDEFQATVDSVFIHGRCGEYNGLGIRGTTADDLIDLIPEKMIEISPFA
jgi:hydroxyethylthiazole kinase-like uncharacterized protein yjeF